MRCSPQDLVLRMSDGHSVATPRKASDVGFASITVEIVIATVGDCVIQDVIDVFGSSVSVQTFDLDDARLLGLAARDWLIAHAEPADLNIYLEDDLVIHDPLLPEKIIWIAEKSDHQCVLLPHRYELIQSHKHPSRLFIDGPSNHDAISDWHQPLDSCVSGRFRGVEPVVFDVPSNPHSGFFAVTKFQLGQLAGDVLPRAGFVGPLETAATLTVGQRFKILKPSFACRNFLTLEHAHPSYLGYLAFA